MEPIETKHRTLMSTTALTRVVAGTLVAAGIALAIVSPAMADDDDWERGEGGHRHNRHSQYYGQYGQYYDPYAYGGYYGGGYYYQPAPVYVQPAPVYVAPPPPPPVYYYEPRPSFSIVLPIHIK